MTAVIVIVVRPDRILQLSLALAHWAVHARVNRDDSHRNTPFDQQTVAVSAIKELLDRGYGKATQPIAGDPRCRAAAGQPAA